MSQASSAIAAIPGCPAQGESRLLGESPQAAKGTLLHQADGQAGVSWKEAASKTSITRPVDEIEPETPSSIDIEEGDQTESLTTVSKWRGTSGSIKSNNQKRKRDVFVDDIDDTHELRTRHRSDRTVKDVQRDSVTQITPAVAEPASSSALGWEIASGPETLALTSSSFGNSPESNRAFTFEAGSVDGAKTSFPEPTSAPLSQYQKTNILKLTLKAEYTNAEKVLVLQLNGGSIPSSELVAKFNGTAKKLGRPLRSRQSLENTVNLVLQELYEMDVTLQELLKEE